MVWCENKCGKSKVMRGHCEEDMSAEILRSRTEQVDKYRYFVSPCWQRGGSLSKKLRVE